MRELLINWRAHRKARDRETGVSLVEVLVYIALLAVLSVMITSIITSTLNNTQRISNTATTSAQVNTAANSIQRDLSLAQDLVYAGPNRIDFHAAINGTNYLISIFAWDPTDTTNGTSINSLPNVPAVIPNPADHPVLYEYRKNLGDGTDGFTILVDGYNATGFGPSTPLFIYYDTSNGSLPAGSLDARANTSATVVANQPNRNKVARIQFNVAATVVGRNTPLQISSSVTPFFNGGSNPTGVYNPPAGACSDGGGCTTQCISVFNATINSNSPTLDTRRTTVLQWNAPYGATSYTLYRYDMGENQTTEKAEDLPVVILDPSQTTFRDDGSNGVWLIPTWGHTYKYTITVSYSFGISPECGSRLATIQPEPPVLVNQQPYAYGYTNSNFTNPTAASMKATPLSFTSTGTSGTCGSAALSTTSPTVSMTVPTYNTSTGVGGTASQSYGSTVNPMSSHLSSTAATDPCSSDVVKTQNYFYSVARGLVNQLSWSWSKGATEYYICLVSAVVCDSSSNLAVVTLSSLQGATGVFNFVWQDTDPTRVKYDAVNSYEIVAHNAGGDSLPSSSSAQLFTSPPSPNIVLKETTTDDPATTTNLASTQYLYDTVEGAPGTDATRPDTGGLDPNGNTYNNVIVTNPTATKATMFVVSKSTITTGSNNCASLARTDTLNFSATSAAHTDVLGTASDPVGFGFIGTKDNVAWGSSTCYNVIGFNSAGLGGSGADNQTKLDQYPAPYGASTPTKFQTGPWLVFDLNPNGLRDGNGSLYCWWGRYGGTDEPDDTCANGSGYDGQGFVGQNYYNYLGTGWYTSASSGGSLATIYYAMATVNGGQKYSLDRCMIATSFAGTQIHYPGEGGTASYQLSTNGTQTKQSCINSNALSMPYQGTQHVETTVNTTSVQGVQGCTFGTNTVTPPSSNLNLACSVKFALTAEMPGSVFMLWSSATAPTGIIRTINTSTTIASNAAGSLRGEEFYVYRGGATMTEYASKSIAMGFGDYVQLQSRWDSEGTGTSNAASNGIDPDNPGWTKSLPVSYPNGQITTGDPSCPQYSYLNSSGVNNSGSTRDTSGNWGVPTGLANTYGCFVTPPEVSGFSTTMKGVQVLWNPRNTVSAAQIGSTAYSQLPTRANGLAIRAFGFLTGYNIGNFALDENSYDQGGHSRYQGTLDSHAGSSTWAWNQWLDSPVAPAVPQPLKANSFMCKYMDEADPSYRNNAAGACPWGWGYPQAPTSITVVTPPTFDLTTLKTTYTINWPAVQGATGYQVSYTTTSNPTPVTVYIPAQRSTTAGTDDLTTMGLDETKIFFIDDPTTPQDESKQQLATQTYAGIVINKGDAANISVKAYNLNYNPSNPDGHGNNPSGSETDPLAAVTVINGSPLYFDGSANRTATANASSVALTTPVLTLASIAATQVNLSWTQVGAATAYDIYANIDNAGWNKIATVTGSSTITYAANWSETDADPVQYEVKATASGLSSDFSNIVIARPRPTITAVWSGTTPVITWSALAPYNGTTGNITYKLYRTIDSGSATVIDTVATSDYSTPISFTDTDIVKNDGQKVKYYVAATHSSFGATVKSVTVTLTGVLDTPVLVANTATATSTPISWTQINAATGYSVYQSINGAAYTLVDTITDPTIVTDSFVWVQNDAKQYRYYIKATNASVTSPNSNTVTFVGNLTSPTLSGGAAGSATTITLNWTAVAGATSYKLQESINGAAYTTVYTGTALTYSKTRDMHSSYNYKVYASSSYTQTGPTSNVVAVAKVIPNDPSAPTGLTHSSTSPTSSTLSWTAVSCEFGTAYYQIQQVTKNGSAVTTIVATWQTANSLALTTSNGLAYGSTVGFHVQALCQGPDGTTERSGASAYSSTDSWTTTVPTPTAPTGLTHNTAGTVSWTAFASCPSGTTAHYNASSTRGGGANTSLSGSTATSFTISSYMNYSDPASYYGASVAVACYGPNANSSYSTAASTSWDLRVWTYTTNQNCNNIRGGPSTGYGVVACVGYTGQWVIDRWADCNSYRWFRLRNTSWGDVWTVSANVTNPQTSGVLNSCG